MRGKMRKRRKLERRRKKRRKEKNPRVSLNISKSENSYILDTCIS